MDDDSVNVFAKLKMPMPELLTFTICTWVKSHFEVSNSGLVSENIFQCFPSASFKFVNLVDSMIY